MASEAASALFASGQHTSHILIWDTPMEKRSIAATCVLTGILRHYLLIINCTALATVMVEYGDIAVIKRKKYY